MYEILLMVLTLLEIQKILAHYYPNLFISSPKEFFNCYFKAKVKAYRIIYPVLLILLTLEPQSWWKVLIMVITVESSVKIATPIANWTCSKLGF